MKDKSKPEWHLFDPLKANLLMPWGEEEPEVCHWVKSGRSSHLRNIVVTWEPKSRESCDAYSTVHQFLRNALGQEQEDVFPTVRLDDIVLRLHNLSLESQVKRHDYEIGELKKSLAEVKNSIQLGTVHVETPPVFEWIEKHPEEVFRFRGKWIAVHPKNGIVTSGTIEEIKTFLDAFELKNEVLIEFVPAEDVDGVM